MALSVWLTESLFYRVDILFASAVITWLISILYTGIMSPLRKIPGPFYTRYTNLPLKIAVIRGQRIYHIHALHKVYGSVVRISPNEVSVADADSFRTIHRAGSRFMKSDFYARFVNQPVPAMLDMSDPKQHAARRKLFARPFSKSELRTNWEGMLRSKTELAIEKIKDEMMANGKADVLKWLFFLATDMTGHLLFGASFQMLENGTNNQYGDTIKVAKGGAIVAELPFLRFIGKLLPFAILHSKEFIFFSGQMALSIAKAPGSNEGSIFPQLLKSANDPGPKDDGISHSLTDLDLATEAGSFMIAGTGSGFAVTYLIWTVLLHPTIQSALEAEVATLDDKFCDADLEKLRLLNAVINEIMRLYGVVSGSLPSIVPHGGIDAGTHFIPEGTIVSTQIWTVHRDEKLWPDPDSFKPERWLADVAPDAGKTVFAPFGVGSRGCLGNHLAMMEIRIAAALFFRQLKGVKLAPETAAQKLKFENFFLVKPMADVCFIMAG